MKTHYIGNLTCCGTHAMYSAFFDTWNFDDIISFETFTTVPFGIIHKEDNPYRLFTCYCDPDYGIQKALHILQIPYRMKYFKKETEKEEAFALLDTWLETENVVLGPLNMQDLTYISSSHLLESMDHYIVVCGKRKGRYVISDSEGFCVNTLSRENLARAWKADKIPEGRGLYTMRQVLDRKKPVYGKQEYEAVYPEFLENMNDCEKQHNGGSHGLLQIAEDSEVIMSSANLKRRMFFDISVRMQRCEIIRHCLEQISILFPGRLLDGECEKGIDLLKQQVAEYNNTMRKMREGNIRAFEAFSKIAGLEYKIMLTLNQIGEII